MDCNIPSSLSGRPQSRPPNPNYPLPPFNDRPNIPLHASGTPDSSSSEQVFQLTSVQHLQNDSCDSESKYQIARRRLCYDSCQQDNEKLDPLTVSLLPESSAICDPSAINNDSGVELPGNCSALEEVTFSANSFVSEPFGIGLPGNRSAQEELACSAISSESKPSDPSMTAEDSDPSLTKDNPDNCLDPFQFQSEFETEAQSSCPRRESCLEFKNKKNDLSNYNFSSTPGYNSLTVQTNFHDASIQTPPVYDSHSDSSQSPISALRVFPIIACPETCPGASGYNSNEKQQVSTNSGIMNRFNASEVNDSRSNHLPQQKHALQNLRSWVRICESNLHSSNIRSIWYLPYCYMQTPQHVVCNVNNESSSSISSSVTESQESGITSGMSPKIFKELPDNVKEPFLLDMSSWQRDSTRFGTVFTGPNGETLLPPHTFAKLDTLVDELSQSKYQDKHWLMQNPIY